MSAKKLKEKRMEFEVALSKLNEIKEKLDSPDITLDESIKLYEKSITYTKTCIDKLKEADGKIVVLKSELDGVFEKPFNAEE